jgi:hypothetical protein
MKPVTDLCAYFETLADTYEHTNQKTLVVTYTDGFDDGNPREVTIRLRKAAARLAANPNFLGVVLVGLVPESRPGWAGLLEMLAPPEKGAKRLRVEVLTQQDMSTERVQGIIEAIATRR